MSILTQEQENEFALNRLGYYCRVRSVWNNTRKKNDFMFDIVHIENDIEAMIQKGTKVFSVNETEGIKQRDKIINFYLNKLKNEKN